MQIFLSTVQNNSTVTAGNGAIFIVLLGGLIPLLLFAVIFILLCRMIAKQKNISKHYMWLGLTGVIGLIIVALIPRGKNTAERLMEQKQLLDCGIITLEEFEKRKKQILKQGKGDIS